MITKELSHLNARRPEELGFHNMYFPPFTLTLDEFRDLAMACPDPLWFLVQYGEWIIPTPRYTIETQWEEAKYYRIFIVLDKGYFTVIPKFQP